MFSDQELEAPEQNIEDLADKVAVNYELLQEENKLLMQEREFYFDQKLKKLN